MNDALPYGSFWRTPHGAFVRSRLGARGGQRPTPSLLLCSSMYNDWVKRWTGSSWVDAISYCLNPRDILYHSVHRKVYVCGAFTTVNGQTIYYVTRTSDGITFDDLGYQSSWGKPYFMLEVGNDLLVSSIYSGDPPRLWNGTSWSLMGSSGWPWYLTANYGPKCGLYSGGNLFLAGTPIYNWPTSGECCSMVRWNGSEWVNTHKTYEHYFYGTLHYGGYDYAMIEFGGEIYLYEDIEVPYSGPEYFFRWNGTDGDWTRLNVPHNVGISERGLVVYDGKIICASSNLYWTDLTGEWSAYQGGVSGGGVYHMLVDNGNLIIVGDFTQVGGSVAANGAAYWDGSEWHAMGSISKEYGMYVPYKRIGGINVQW